MRSPFWEPLTFESASQHLRCLLILALHKEQGVCKQFPVVKVFVQSNRKYVAYAVAQVQLWFSIVVISVMLSVYYITPASQRGVVLWLPPLLQLLPAVVHLFSPAW